MRGTALSACRPKIDAISHARLSELTKTAFQPAFGDVIMARQLDRQYR